MGSGAGTASFLKVVLKNFDILAWYVFLLRSFTQFALLTPKRKKKKKKIFFFFFCWVYERYML
jgi:hypothetical protein